MTEPEPPKSELSLDELIRMGMVHYASIMRVAESMCCQTETEVLGAEGRVSQVDTSFDQPAHTEARRYSILGIEPLDTLAKGPPPRIFPGPTDADLAEIYAYARESLSRISILKGGDVDLPLAVYLSPHGHRSEWVIRLEMSSRVVGPEPGRIEVRCISVERLRAEEVELKHSEEQTG